MYIEIDLYAFLFVIPVIVLIAILSFILGIKQVKAYNRKNKPKKDKAQLILNKLNDKIIDTQYQLDQMQDNETKQYIKDRLMAFHYVKGMVEAVINEEDKNE